MIQKDASGSPTPSYAYQVNCPNDQNLVYVQGRALFGQPPPEPLMNRQGIPKQELGQCVRCNLQMEGSGPRPTDVNLDAGTGYSTKGPSAKPSGHSKHVVLRVDRGDGFVGRNFLMRGGLEFGFYTEETDGVLLDKTKFYWNADYGHLSFTSDHHVVKNCDGFGAGDAALYPGAAPETGAQATDFYPDAPRANTVIKQCDMRGSGLGYSGSMGNGVRITNNHIYGNSTGIATDTLSAAGHPGFPADSSEIDNNFIYSNNLNLYRKDTPVKPLITVPVGTGIIYAGHQRRQGPRQLDLRQLARRRDAVRGARRADQRVQRRAAVAQVRDRHSCGAEGEVLPGVSCAGAPANGLSTSCNNRFYNNKMGQVPPGFKFPAAVDQFGTARSLQSRAPDAQRQRLLVGRVLLQPVELLVRQHRRRRHRRQRDRSRARPAARPACLPTRFRMRRGQQPRLQRGQRRRRQGALPRGLLRGARRGDRPARLRLVEHSAAAGQSAAAGTAAASSRARRAVSPALHGRRTAAQPDGGADRGRVVPASGLGTSRLVGRDPARRLRRRRGGAAPAGEAAEKPAESVGRRSAGSVVQFADCDDWRRGSRAEREVTVVELRDQLTIQSERSNASPLPDERAYEIIQKACKPDFAGSLRLYKLYARAQGFAPLNE